MKKKMLGEGVTNVGHVCATVFGAAWPSSMVHSVKQKKPPREEIPWGLMCVCVIRAAVRFE